MSGAFTEHGVPRMVEMMQLFRRDRADLIARPMSIFTITATGNFRYSEDSCQNLIDCVEAGIPVEIVPVTLMGLIAPVTIVGATVFHTVDVLAGITMAQVIRPGAPVLFGGAPATFHMKIASVADGGDRGAPARRRLRRGRQVARAADASRTWPCPTAKILDAQAGAETFGSALLAALAGVNSVSGPGMLDFLLVFSLPKLVFDDEMCGQALHFVREVQPLDDLPVARADRPADGRPAPDHGRRTRWPTGRPSCTCRARSSIATTARLAAGRRQGHLPAGRRRGRPPARGLPPARDRPGDRRRAARDHPVRAGRPDRRCRTSRRRPSPPLARPDRRTPPQPPPRTLRRHRSSARRIPA